MLAHNYRAISRQFDVWNTADAWCALKAIIVEQLGVQPEIVTREASFARDLQLEISIYEAHNSAPAANDQNQTHRAESRIARWRKARAVQ